MRRSTPQTPFIKSGTTGVTYSGTDTILAALSGRTYSFVPLKWDSYNIVFGSIIYSANAPIDATLTLYICDGSAGQAVLDTTQTWIKVGDQNAFDAKFPIYSTALTSGSQLKIMFPVLKTAGTFIKPEILYNSGVSPGITIHDFRIVGSSTGIV